MIRLHVHEIPWPDGTMTYEVRTPGRGHADDYEPGECLAVLPTRAEAEAWIAVDQEKAA